MHQDYGDVGIEGKVKLFVLKDDVAVELRVRRKTVATSF